MFRLFCLAVLLLATTVETTFYWEYGHDSRNLEMVHHIVGQIKPEEKSLYISLQVPECIDIKHVMVMVQNRNAPTVTYNMQTNTVKIIYKPQQISVSRYDITMKGKRKSQCSDVELLKLKRVEGTSHCETYFDYYRRVLVVGCGWGVGDNAYHGGYYGGY